MSAEVDVVLEDREEDTLRVLTLDVHPDDLLDALRAGDAYCSEVHHTVETDVLLAVDGYAPNSVSVWPVDGIAEEMAFEDYFGAHDLTDFVDSGDSEDEEGELRTSVVFSPVTKDRRERVAATVGYVKEVAASLE